MYIIPMVMLDVMLTVATAMTTTTMTMMTVASMLTMMMIAHVPMMTTTWMVVDIERSLNGD